jgi:tetratricopeptide (TPR) repeat protein
MFRALALLMSLFVVAGPARGDTSSDYGTCLIGEANERAYEIMVACSRVVRSRRLAAGDRAQAYFKRAQAQLIVTGWGRAFADYTAAIALEPNFAMAYLARAELLLEQGDFDGARSDCGSALRASRGSEQVYMCHVRAYSGLGDTRRALSAFRRALDVSADPSVRRILRNSETEALLGELLRQRP